jgi:hypothetical protein
VRRSTPFPASPLTSTPRNLPANAASADEHEDEHDVVAAVSSDESSSSDDEAPSSKRRKDDRASDVRTVFRPVELVKTDNKNKPILNKKGKPVYTTVHDCMVCEYVPPSSCPCTHDSNAESGRRDINAQKNTDFQVRFVGGITTLRNHIARGSPQASMDHFDVYRERCAVNNIDTNPRCTPREELQRAADAT